MGREYKNVGMRVLFFTQYFVPEVTAPRVRAQAFAEGLARLGHEVEVVCEVPNHPTGIVYPGYGGRWRDRRRLEGYDATYVWVRARPEKSTRNRMLFYGTYAASASAAGSLARRPDVVLASSPPLPVGAAAAFAAARHRVPWVLDVRDLWPEAAVILGELRGERAIRAASWLERRLYRSAEAIVTVTEPFRAQIAELAPGKRIEVITNGTTRPWLDAGEAPRDRDSAGLPGDRFCWMYAGNLGIAQGLEHAIEAQRLLGAGFRLVLLGGGPEAEKLRELAASLPSGEVEFRDPVQPEVAAGQMRAADALLVSLAPQPELAKFLPSKLFDCCALGRPVILAAAGVAPALAEEAGAALVVSPGDPAGLAAAVRSLSTDAQLAERLSTAGRVFAAGYLRESLVERLERLLVEVAGG